MSGTKELRDRSRSQRAHLGRLYLLQQATWALETLTHRLAQPALITPGNEAADTEPIGSRNRSARLDATRDDEPSARQRHRWVRGLHRPS